MTVGAPCDQVEQVAQHFTDRPTTLLQSKRPGIRLKSGVSVGMLDALTVRRIDVGGQGNKGLQVIADDFAATC